MSKIAIKDDLDTKAKKSAYEKVLRAELAKQKIYLFGEYDPKLDELLPDMKLKGPNPLQKQILEAWGNPRYKVFTFTGGNRMGKTTIEAIIAICIMAGEWLWSGEKIAFPHNKPRKVRYVGQDWEEHIKTVVEPALNEWWPSDRPVKKKKNNQGINATWIDVKTGSELIIMSNKQDSGTHEGWEGDLVIYDEPPKRDIRVANARGLVDRMGREFFGMTLLKEAWIHREVMKAVDSEGRPEDSLFSIEGEIYDNIGFGLTKEGVDQFAKTLKPEEREARLHGKPSYLSGLIFPKLDRQTHIKDRFTVPLDWIVDIAIDWHPSKAWHILFMATDNMNRKWIVDEIVEKNNYKYIGEEIIRKIRKNDYRIEDSWLMDPLAKSGSQGDILEETVYDKLDFLISAYGYSLSTPSKDENSGIDLINEYLITESEEPAYFLFRDCVVAIQQHEDWMWVDGKPASIDEDQCENAYRIMNRGTQYYPIKRQTSKALPTDWRVV